MDTEHTLATHKYGNNIVYGITTLIAWGVFLKFHLSVKLETRNHTNKPRVEGDTGYSSHVKAKTEGSVFWLCIRINTAQG